MNVLSVSSLTFSYPGRKIASDLSFGLAAGEKVALVGENGSGKSTLLRLLTGDLEPDSGSVVINSGCRVAMLLQDPELPSGISVFTALLQSPSPRLKAYADYLEQEANSVLSETTLRRMDETDGWRVPGDIRSVLHALNLDPDRRTDELSGGERRKVSLAIVLFSDADFLILDEPTNHLDLSTMDFLENRLQETRATLLMITHDRYFLENVAERILELDQGELRDFRGSYSLYLDRKAALNAAADRARTKAAALWRQEAEWLQKQPRARGTKSRARTEAAIDLQKKAKVKEVSRKSLTGVTAPQTGKEILECINLSFFRESRAIIRDFSYSFRRRQKIAITGRNGSGKTTLLHLLNSDLVPASGKVITGFSSRTGIFRQSDSDLPGDRRVLDYLREEVGYRVEWQNADGTIQKTSAEELLEEAGFPSRSFRLPISSLSGGERRRLRLVQLFLSNPNIMFLDEPTNDLDLHILGMLENRLADYTGVLVFVSHDRAFLDRLADTIFFLPGDGSVQVFEGNYTENSVRMIHAVPGKARDSSSVSAPAERRSSRQEKLTYSEEREFAALEPLIAELEHSLQQLTNKLSAPSGSEDFAALGSDLETTRKKLEASLIRWEYLAHKKGL